MIFTDYSQIQKTDKGFNRNENKTCVIRFKNGDIFKQITMFEEVYYLSEDKKKSTSGYGAWFVSEKDSLFLTAETINELLKENKAEYIQGSM